ncbi:hypothetical protein CTAYLR_005571 [Chrysophaeum taylorii]|uniref:Uncharacterized protein n=1 Tax=Chrysophaeum taylorii TaxID=2483200 RepID=A0AAD7XH83_9STRA|nr:hypothetical protein CTAYLR_005571 [Chrysophaeum taylorii]
MRARSPWSFEEAREYARSFGFKDQAEYREYRCPGAYALPRDPDKAFAAEWTSWGDFLGSFQQVLFVQVGWGADQHGQNVTKAAVRAARNAIEFNSIPSIAAIVPGSYANMLLRISIAAPEKYHHALDKTAVAAVFPYGNIIACDIQPGGAVFSSGIAIEAMGDTSEDMIVVNVGVVVGY